MCKDRIYLCIRQTSKTAAKEVREYICLVNLMDYDLGYIDLETPVLEPLENPFGPKCYPCDRYKVLGWRWFKCRRVENRSFSAKVHRVRNNRPHLKRR